MFPDPTFHPSTSRIHILPGSSSRSTSRFVKPRNPDTSNPRSSNPRSSNPSSEFPSKFPPKFRSLPSASSSRSKFRNNAQPPALIRSPSNSRRL